MILFHCDLDQTLIYSYKHEIGPDKTCVEVYQGKELSFMTKEALLLLEQIQSQVVFVPTTTRSVEQYERIDFGFVKPKYALVCNGSVLLENGQRDLNWYKESCRLIEGAREEMELALSLLEQDEQRCFEVRYVENLFLFTKSKKPEETLYHLKEKLKGSQSEAYQNGSKIYVVPKVLSKGVGVQRLKERLKPSRVIAAGDSVFDISMLLAADRGMCPLGLFNQPPGHVSTFGSDFTESMLKQTKALLTEKWR